VKDANGSINTKSSSKTNFWTYVQTLFLVNPAKDVGLAGYSVQNYTAKNMNYNSTEGYWEAGHSHRTL
jgi:hypothetical protein